MKIAIVELDYHWNVLNGLCAIFMNAGFEITLFARKDIKEKLSGQAYFDQYTWITLPVGTSKKAFLEANRTRLNKSDLVIFDTIASDHKTYANLNLNTSTVLRVHNANTWLGPNKHIKIDPTVYHIRKSFSYFTRLYLLQRDYHWKKKIIERFDCISFLDYGISEHVRSKFPSYRHKIGLPIPFITTSGEFKALPESPLLILSIPGMNINSQRKDFEKVVDALASLPNNKLEKVKLNIFGKPVDKVSANLLEKFRQLKERNLTLNEIPKITQEIFDKTMWESHLFLVPLKTETRHRPYLETYGSTKFSGGVADIIKYGRLGIFPESHYFDEDISAYIPRYKISEDISKIIENYIDKRELLLEDTKGWQQKALEKYQTNRFLERFKEYFPKAPNKPQMNPE